MNKLSSYILKQILIAVMVITVVLSCIMWLAQTLRYVELIANKEVPLSLFFNMILYLFPNIFVITIPISVLLGTLFIYNKLTTDHELAAMQAAGVSHWQLAKPVLLASVLLSIFLYSLTLYFLPFSFRKHRDMVLLLRQESLASLISDGQFNTFKNYTIYAHRQEGRGHFLGVLLYDTTQPKSPIFFLAEEGVLVNKEKEGYLLLFRGSRQERDAVTGCPSVLYFERYLIDPKNRTADNKTDERMLRAHERSTWELLTPQASLDPYMKKEFSSAAHQRLILPLYPVIFGLIGVNSILRGQFNRKGRVGKMTIACILVLIIQVLEMILFHGWNENSTIWLCYGVVLAPLIISLLLLFPSRYFTQGKTKLRSFL